MTNISPPPRPVTGQSHRIQRGPLTPTDLVMYAGASCDFNPIHHDYQFAIGAGQPGLLAHGMLIMGFAGTCVMDFAGPTACVTGLSGRFTAPVFVGDVVDLIATVIEDGGEHGLVFELEGRVGAKTVFQGQAKANC